MQLANHWLLHSGWYWKWIHWTFWKSLLSKVRAPKVWDRVQSVPEKLNYRYCSCAAAGEASPVTYCLPCSPVLAFHSLSLLSIPKAIRDKFAYFLCNLFLRRRNFLPQLSRTIWMCSNSCMAKDATPHPSWIPFVVPTRALDSPLWGLSFWSLLGF